MSFLKESDIQEIRERILPLVGPHLQLEGLMVYGSRVSGKNRDSSDIDVLALVKSAKEDFYGEYHGALETTLPVEMRLYSKQKLNDVLIGKDAIRLSAISSGFVMEDCSGFLAQAKQKARARFHSLLQSFSEEIQKMDRTYIENVLITALSEGHINVMYLMRQGQYSSALALLVELMNDFVVYSECLRLQREKDFSFETLSGLYFIRQGRGGRFYNRKKYQVSHRVWRLIEEFDAVLASPDEAFAEKCENIFSLLNRSFVSLQNKALILSPNEWPETVLRLEDPNA